MEISALSSPAPAPVTKPTASTIRRGNPSAAGANASAAVFTGDPANLGNFQSIQQAMHNLPDSRVDVIARGKMLAASSTYPAAEIIDKLAAMFIADAKSDLAAD